MIEGLFQPVAGDTDDARMIEAAILCVEEFTRRFNARDLAGMDALLHFPHVILSGENLVVWNEAGQLPAAFFKDLERETGWVETVYRVKLPVLVNPRKVHLLLEYTRNRSDGSIASTHRNLWVVTLEGERWGIRLRSY